MRGFFSCNTRRTQISGTPITDTFKHGYDGRIHAHHILLLQRMFIVTPLSGVDSIFINYLVKIKFAVH